MAGVALLGALVRSGRGEGRALAGTWRTCSSGAATDSIKDPIKPRGTRKPEVSTAMRHYLAKKKERDAFIAKERSQFELGKKHLGNMMGTDPETMTQQDIDKAIDYLFPSGLYHPEARPIMKPPEEIFPKEKDVEFDVEGRPFHPFFYTVTPKFCQSVHEMVEHHERLLFFQDRMVKQNKKPDAAQLLNENRLASTRWLTLEEMRKAYREEIEVHQHDAFIALLERLLENPFAYREKEALFRYRTPVGTFRMSTDAIEPKFDENGNAYVEFIGQRKTSMAKVKVTKPGTGQVRITHIDYPDHVCDISYFFSSKERHQLLYPLQFTRLLGRVDLDCLVFAGGCSSQAGAIRYAMSMALRSFVDEETMNDMKAVGLLTQDIRTRERKKPGQKGARAKYTWLKR